MRVRDFVIDQRIVESDLGRVGIGIAKINAGEASPIDCPQTHGTGLTGGVNLAGFEIKDAEYLACFAYSDNFRVCGRIVRGSDLVCSLRDNRAVLHHDRTEGTAVSGENVLKGELNGASHERIVHVYALSMRNR